LVHYVDGIINGECVQVLLGENLGQLLEEFILDHIDVKVQGESKDEVTIEFIVLS
jgi:hypothetical protein